MRTTIRSTSREKGVKGRLLASAAVAIAALLFHTHARAEIRLTAAVNAENGTVAVHSSPGIADILKMVDAKIDADVIKAYIQSSRIAYNPSVTEIIALKDRGVSSDILTALLQRGAEVRAQAIQSEPYRPASPAPNTYPTAVGPYTPPAAYDYAQPAYYDYPYSYPAYSSYSYSYPYYGCNYGYNFGCSWPFFWPFDFCGGGFFHHDFDRRGGFRNRGGGFGHEGFAGRGLPFPGRAGSFGGRSAPFAGHAGGFSPASFGGHSTSFASHGGGGFHGGGGSHGGGGFHGGGGSGGGHSGGRR